MQIVYLKLVTGEDIIAYAESVDEEYVHVHKPITVHTKNTERGAILRSTQWIPFTEQNDFPIKRKNIVILSNPSRDMEDYYHETLDILDDMILEPIDPSQEQLDKLDPEDREAYDAFFELYANNEVKVH